MKKGWPALAAAVVAYDAWAIAANQSTLSCEFKDWAARNPAAATAVTTYLVAHLWGFCPPRVDPFNLFAGAMRALWVASSPTQQPSGAGLDAAILPDVVAL